MMSNTTIEKGDTVKIHYKCTLDDGTIASDSKATNEPLEFNVGEKIVLSGIDEEIIGMETGEEKSFVLSPDRGYGEYFEDRISNLPKTNIPEQFVEQIEEGSVIPLMSKDGTSRLIATVKEVLDDDFVVDLNHPLAGKTLYFDVEVLEVNKPTTETVEDVELPTEGTE
tara:strand:+ start:511 stop:1014 length:504 start_codon:yes stop_codon:yes gene_type:complete